MRTRARFLFFSSLCDCCHFNDYIIIIIITTTALTPFSNTHPPACTQISRFLTWTPCLAKAFFCRLCRRPAVPAHQVQSLSRQHMPASPPALPHSELVDHANNNWAFPSRSKSNLTHSQSSDLFSYLYCSTTRGSRHQNGTYDTLRTVPPLPTTTTPPSLLPAPHFPSLLPQSRPPRASRKRAPPHTTHNPLPPSTHFRLHPPTHTRKLHYPRIRAIFVSSAS
ncbi:hypothetical protein EJ06DRAFT_155595 [Trichodelitschia bisporula]|uniref:Uncharacterized protein n=1 Tax=Trichodelitschia bisporula TaxID=703511 RepID=A0A6G1HNZ0_9PEZI|nr:hypothetical protein EJ06DRAFT_155595 [Trichodelitschia bisporula]